MGDGSPPAAVLIIVTRSPLLPPVVSKYARRDVRCENSEAEDGEDLAHQQVRLLAQLCPSSWTSRWCRWLPSRPSSISWCCLFEKIVTPKLGAWPRMSMTRRTITAGGAVRHLLHVMDLRHGGRCAVAAIGAGHRGARGPTRGPDHRCRNPS
jgi:hypothetical protein